MTNVVINISKQVNQYLFYELCGRNDCVMKRIIRKWIVFLLTIFIFVGTIQIPTKSYAMNIIPVNTKMYTTSGTAVYAKPDVYSGVVLYLERFVNVTVTGITENGFYRVDLNGDYYIPGVFLVSQVAVPKSAKQLALENLNTFADAYRIQLEQMESYSTKFALEDINGDGIPELFDDSGKEIYRFYGEHAVMIYYNENPTKFYYTKDHKRLAGKYTWVKTDVWEAYFMDYSLFPWGQVKCFSQDVSDIKNNLKEVERKYTNDAATRADLYNILKTILSL